MKRKISVIALTICLLVSCLTFFASARASKTFVSCDAKIEACSDGSLKVNEKWVVSFKGEFKDLTRSIETNKDNSALGYSDIVDVAVAVNGKPLTRAESDLDSTFTAAKSKDGTSFDIDIFSKALDETKTYDISYTMTKAIKADGSRARIAFCFLGNSFDGACNNVSVEIKLPENVSANDIVVDDETGSFFLKKDDNGLVTYGADSVYEDFVIDFSVPNSSFDVSKLAKASTVKDFFKKVLKVLEIVVPILLFIAAVILVFIFAINKDRRIRRKIEKELISGVEKMPENPTLPESITPVKAYKMLTPYNKLNPRQTSKDVPVIFGLTVLECIENGYIAYEDGVLRLTEKVGEKPEDYQQSCMNFLKQMATDDGKINDTFYKNVSAECTANYDKLANYLVSFYELIPETNAKFFKNAENVALYEKVYLVKYAALQSKNTRTYLNCIEKMLTGSSVQSPEVFGAVFGKHARGREFFESKCTNSLSALSASIGDMAKVFIPKK